MATWDVDSSAAGTGAGTSWVNACTTIAAAITLSAARDDFNVLSTHAETAASTKTLAFKGTAAAPNRVFSCTNTHSPAQAGDLTAGASVSATGNSAVIIRGYAYIYGITFNAGAGASSASQNYFSIGNSGKSGLVFDTCSLRIKATTTGDAADFGAGANYNKFTLINTVFEFGDASQGIQIHSGRFTWKNTTSAIAGTAPTTLFFFDQGISVVLDGVDLSAMGSGKTIFAAAQINAPIYQLINCKLGASVTICATPSDPADASLEVFVSDSAATGYRQERYQYQGTLTASTSVYNNASDGATPISWQVVTTANANRQAPFECFQIAQWAPAGTYASSLMQITSADATLTNADVWADVEYLGNGSFPVSSLVSSGPATQLTAGSSLAAGTWATGSLGHDYKLAIPSFTTSLAGYVRITVKVAKASLTLNVDPSVVIA